MKELLRSRLGWLRIIGFLEGVSYLLLLFIAMPLKYLAGQPEMVRITGMAHGILFMAYIPLVLYVMAERDWPIKKAALAMLASLIPFGTFWAEFRLFRETPVLGARIQDPVRDPAL
jgi:integral membrane protein